MRSTAPHNSRTIPTSTVRLSCTAGRPLRERSITVLTNATSSGPRIAFDGSLRVWYESEPGAEVVHLIADSMGNRALAAALGQMAPPTASQARFSQVVLTAPDIDVGLFPALAARLKRVAGRVTMYASEHDLALEAARKYDTFQRVGSTRPVIVLLDGIEVIDASAVDTSFLGHSYIGNSKTVLSDLIDVIGGAAANARKFIELRGAPPLTYWAFR